MQRIIGRYLGLLKEAFKATFAAKSRTLLSALCIGLGIAGITIVAALGTAAVGKANELMSFFGADAVMVVSGSPKKRAAGMRGMTITLEDARQLRANFPDAYLVSPLRIYPSILISYGSAKMSAEVDGVNTSLMQQWDWPIEIGRDLTPTDNDHSANVCLIGSFVAKKLFADIDPIGKQIKVGRSMCEVVGVAVTRSFGAMDDEANSFVMIPDSVFLKKYAWRKNFLQGVRMRFYDAKTLGKQMEDITDFMRHLHNIEEGDANDFTIFTSSTVSAMIFAILGAMGAFLTVITLVVVAVGGFVTANMFLLATQTRVKEIGIRRAFGATSKDIFTQFILEFILITLCGMLVGLGIAQAATMFISSFGVVDAGITPLVFAVTAFMSMVVALTFGILPARSASKVNPIEAIRSL